VKVCPHEYLYYQLISLFCLFLSVFPCFVQLFDEIVKSLPRNKLFKVNRLMYKRYQDIKQLDEARNAELERLYPDIKAVLYIRHLLASSNLMCSV
jgi:hypothetical protein